MQNRINENTMPWTRRDLLKAAGAVTVGATLARFAQAEPDTSAPANDAPFIQIGIFLESFTGKTLEAKLDALKAAGLDCVQLSMDSAGLAPMPDEIAPEMIARI